MDHARLIALNRYLICQFCNPMNLFNKMATVRIFETFYSCYNKADVVLTHSVTVMWIKVFSVETPPSEITSNV